MTNRHPDNDPATGATEATRRARGTAALAAITGASGAAVIDSLADIAPELGEWATYLAVPADLVGGVPDRVADDRVRDAERFLRAVERVVGRRTP